MYLLRPVRAPVPLLLAVALATVTACSGTATGTLAENDAGPSRNGSSGASGATVTDGPADTSQPAAPPAKKRAFVTSQAYDGDLKSKVPSAASGVEAGDALCQIAADAALLNGRFKAFLASGGAPATDRLAEVGPWFLVDKGGAEQRLFNNKANMATQPLVAFSNDERGEAVGSEWAWTGASGLDCEGWTKSPGGYEGMAGFALSKDSSWRGNSTGIGTPCNRAYRLYCFEQ